jgi:hypothetical protein
MARDLGGSVSKYKRERANAMKGIVSEIYSTPRVTKMIQMMPSSQVWAGFALDFATCDADGRAWNFDGEEMRNQAQARRR